MEAKVASEQDRSPASQEQAKGCFSLQAATTVKMKIRSDSSQAKGRLMRTANTRSLRTVSHGACPLKGSVVDY